MPTIIRTLEELFELKIEKQVYKACWGLNGAGLYGAQCGLVEGTLMFISLLAHRENIEQEKMWQACADFAREYEQQFGSLQCKKLRPGGFNEDDPPMLCKPLTEESIIFSARFIAKRFGLEMKIK
ncbi:MAG: C_GCAxxG_C_C family protein [candidate division Zixibacteria bacterium]|nr:C_GCAxxG_C_C family protein [candidate division Zixibacteria bacterium]